MEIWRIGKSDRHQDLEKKIMMISFPERSVATKLNVTVFIIVLLTVIDDNTLLETVIACLLNVFISGNLNISVTF